MRYFNITLSNVIRKSIAFSIISTLLWLSMAHNLHATTTHTETKQTEQVKAQPKVLIKGDTLVIQDGSCQSHNKTLISTLNTKDSKQTTIQECDEIEHK